MVAILTVTRRPAPGATNDACRTRCERSTEVHGCVTAVLSLNRYVYGFSRLIGGR